jgi:hypothetical protein
MYIVMILLIEAVGIGSSAFFSIKTVPVVPSTRIALRDAVSIGKALQLGEAMIRSAKRADPKTRMDAIGDSIRCFVFIFFSPLKPLQAPKRFKRLCVLLALHRRRYS